MLERTRDELDTLLGKVDDEGALRGDLLFLEGIPTTSPVIERDVINPIFGPYYRDGGTPLANYLSPQPIFFLALGARSPYRFGVASRSDDREAVEQGARWHQGALTELGLGAKAGAGYGYWLLA